MPNSPIFMRAGPLRMAARVQPSAVAASAAARPAARMTTTLSEARLANGTQSVALANPRLAARMIKIRPHVVDVIGQRQEGDARESVKVPISPAPEPTDAMLFEDPADPAKKYYLPRYRLREQGGRYEIGIVAAQDGSWRLSVGLERFPAPELGASAQGAQPLDHTIAVFFRYGAGPSNAIEKRVDFNEKADDPKGVTVSVGLTLGERDNLLFALQSPAANPALVVRRAVTVAAKVHAQSGTSPQELPMLVAKPHIAALAAAQPATLRMARPASAQSTAVMARPAVMRMTTRPLAVDALQNTGIVPPHLQTPPAPVDRYSIIERALDDVADPEPFVLDPRLHPYVYEGAAVGGGGARVSEFRRIVLAHPQGAPDARFHAYLQDKGEPWVFYYLPDRFKLARRDVAPFLPQMVVRIAAPDGAIENASVSMDYMVEPWIDPGRLKAAAAALGREVPAGAHKTEPELRPLQAKASLRLWVPGAGGAVLADQKDTAIDLANGFLHSLTLPLDGFRQLYAAAYSRDATSLFSGQVLVETGLSMPEPVPLEIRFADTQGEVLSFGEQPSEADGTIAVRMKNDIESPVRLRALPVKVRKGDAEVAASVEGISFDVPIELVPGGEVSFTVKPGGALAGDGVMDAVFDTAPVEILPDPEKILPLISDTSVPAQYERQIDVMTMPELMGDAADPNSIILINVEFRGGGNLKLSRDQAQGVAQVQLPLMDLLLGRDTQGKYGFRQQIIRRNGSQTVDPSWREADFSLLVLPIV